MAIMLAEIFDTNQNAGTKVENCMTGLVHANLVREHISSLTPSLPFRLEYGTPLFESKGFYILQTTVAIFVSAISFSINDSSSSNLGLFDATNLTWLKSIICLPLS